ncbi:MAG: aminotransferase class I/II-fold pyridoxal phosphate-dependent enzyme [Melioribacteraceae bacterium]|nr:aminotransferase class I/II-fold pyridoxal phosphate-dependent enzyme [Melioribacteraceae bacterium]MCF8353971.1 aminotransferase class I/II-fold pyridoxal phosphate-dependent enzyme [Melioribacteraceae bacterium]MCF8393699.1 aminotransferase class I/II-fold pyridoxal phosphate-dependent enzyme [Melioribacteraceae bacterium]MCF8419559.1 aminotransferase class I/II-fold pyridoxal phosphate-dependent enzyme [Melioribacteraceae bacterium]
MSDEKRKSIYEKGIEEAKYSMDTHIIYGKNITNKWDYTHHVTAPISSSTTFRLDSVERGAHGFEQFAHTEEFGNEAPIFIYDRLGEPNKDMLEENLAYVEKGETAVTFASGMGAISAVLGVLTKSGDEILTHNTLYGCTISLFNNWYPRYNIDVNYKNLTDLEVVKNNITVRTRVIYLETPANPNLDIIDLPALSNLVLELNKDRTNETRIYIVVDNTFATPYCQRPLTLGADFVVHSLTKGIGGFGTDMGGVVIGPKKFRDMILLYRKDFGAVINPKSAWAILTYGLPTLALRQKQQIASALKIARFLNSHPKVDYVNYPGLESFKYYESAKKQMLNFDGEFAPGSMIYFSLKGENPEKAKEYGKNFMDYVADFAYTMTLAVSLGHSRTLIEHPASMTHSVVPPEKLAERGLDAGGVRLSIGLEKAEDILQDLERAFDSV